MRVDPFQHRGGVGLGRPGGVVLRRRVQWRLSHGRTQSGAIPMRGLWHHRYFCRGRRTAGQGAGSTRAATGPAQNCSFQHGGLAGFGRSGRHQFGSAARTGTHLSRRPSRRVAATGGSVPAARPGHSGLHVGHYRQVQGGHASARRSGLRHARLQRTHSANRRGRTHVLFAAVPHRRAHGRRVLQHVHRRKTELCREPRDHS